MREALKVDLEKLMNGGNIEISHNKCDNGRLFYNPGGHLIRCGDCTTAWSPAWVHSKENADITMRFTVIKEDGKEAKPPEPTYKLVLETVGSSTFLKTVKIG